MSVSVRRLAGVVMAAGFMSVAGAQQKTLPDAQVESNVLKALASAPELSTQDIHTTTVYGVVTLSGSAVDEASRTKAENLAARAEGVKKVVDELTLGGAANAQNSVTAGGGDRAPQLVLQSDGTYAPAGPDASEPGQEQSNAQVQVPPYPQQQTPYPQQQAPYPRQPQPYPQQQAQPGYDANNAPPQQPTPYPNQRPYPARRPMYGGNSAQNGYPAGGEAYPAQSGQVAGRLVTVANGTTVHIRINQGLSTNHATPGEVFDGTVLSDVTADGAVAIPRGAAVQGIVVGVKNSGALKGRGELTLQLTKLTMGGQTYVLSSDIWKEHGQDKTVRTVDSALGLGALGAIIGGVAGGGSGAAIGAGVGAGAGVASSAASPSGKVLLPPETVLTFRLIQPTTVATLSEQEMSRLSYAAGPGYGQPVERRRNYPRPYYGPYPPYYGGTYYAPRF